MKAIGIVSSPHKDGNTAYLLEKTLKVLREKFETETIFLKDYEIKPCEGCYYYEENGKCIINDDMQKLYPKFEDADVIILSSPSYMGGVTSRVRAFMERT
jgi:multimeric flavodoxin WrbA